MEGLRATLPFLLIVAFAHQSIGLKCNAGCVGSSGNVFKYQPGTVYQYEMEGSSVMSLAGADGDVAKMVVKANADVAALPNCAFSISLTNFQVTDKDGKSVAGDKGQPVIFSMNNGAVTSDICSSKDEPMDAMNIKRAIISLLQSSPETKSKSEIDIFGTCPTDTSVHKSGSKLKVKKIKNLSNCAHRQNLMIPFSTTHYHSISDLHSIPWISASQKVDQDVEGQVKWAMSKEEYAMPPAAGAEAGATITVTTKLSLKGTAGGAAPPAGIEKERSIILGVKEHSGENQVKNAGQILKKICEGAQGEIDKNNANLYAYLTYLLSRSNKATMTNLYNQVKQGQICADKETAKKVLFDAIFDSQSADGVQAMSELLKNKEVTGLKASMWYASLGNVRHATLASLKAAASMLDGNAPNEAYLGAGSLLGKYCHSHSCENVPEVNQLQKKLATPLTKGCKAGSLAEEDKLLAGMKGLGNSGYLGGPVTKQLIQCATDHSVRSRIRAAALDTLHSDPDKENIKKAAIGIFKDKNEDAEMRIKAYLIIVECPCGKMAGIVKDVLDTEDSFQVGNFIVSHLRNLRASKNPEKAKAQAHFSGILASKSFPFDIRKYSTNGESSYMLDSLNLGGTAESNVIYSQKSWIPRTVSLNLTSHIFGSNFNLFEMDVRTENLERILEGVVGPQGYLNGDPSDIAMDAHSMWGKFMGRAKQTFRPKRGVSQNDIDALANQVNMGTDATGEKTESLDLSLKMFGSEVAWIPLHGNNLKKSPGDSVDTAFNLLDSILDKAKNIDFDYTKHKVLAEGIVAYPTAMGVPLKIKGVIAAAMHMKMDGKLDIPAILRDPKNALVKFQMISSGAVTGALISMMETAGLNTGVKVAVTTHSSTGSDVTLRLLEGKGIDVKVGLPLAKQDVISVSSDIVSFSDTPQGKNSKPVPFNVKREEYSGCFDQISDIVGLTFCGEVSTPWEGARMISPAYGPSKLSARIEKDDPSLTSFHFKAFFNVQKDAPQHHFEIVLDTPNSKKERRFGLVVENTIQPNLAFKAVVDSPFGGAKFDASAVNTAEEKSVNAELSLGDQEDYVFKAGIKKAGPNKYKPFLEYRAPEKEKSRFSAISGSKQGGQQVTVTGDINVSGNKLIFQGVKVAISRQEYVLDGSVWDDSKGSGVDLKITNPEDVLTIKAQVEHLADHKEKRTLVVASEKYPDVSISATWDLEFKQNKKTTALKSDIIVVHGPDPNSETSRVTLSNSYNSQTNAKGGLIQVDSKNLVEYPIVNLKGKVNFHGSTSKFGYDVEGSFESYKGGSALEVDAQPNYSIDFSGNMMDNSIAVHSKRQKAGPNKSKFTNSLEMHPGGKYQLNALVTHKFEPDDIDAHLEAKITLPADPKNIEINAGVKDNKQAHDGIILVTVDGKNLVDGKVNINKGKELGGTFKFNLPEYVDSNGQFKYTGSGLDGNAVINLIKTNKKIEGKTHFTMNSPQIKGTADLCLDSKCIKLSTDSSISKDNYATKNKLELPAGLVIMLNAKADEAKGVHSADAELKGGDGRRTKVSYGSTRHMRPGDADVEYIAGIEDWSSAGAKPRRMEAKLVGKHINLDAETGDGQLIITYHTPDDKDFSIHTNFKRAPAANNKWIHNAEIGATGSLIESPLNLKFESEADEKLFEGEINDDGSLPAGNYHLTLNVGNALALESQGKTAGHSATNELNINLPQAKEGIKNFKWSTNNHVDSGHKEGTRTKLKTSNTVKWDNKFIKGNFEINEEEDGINFNMDYEGDSISKRTLSGNVHPCISAEGDVCKSESSLAVTWEDKKADVSFTSQMDPSKKAGHVHLKGTMPDGTKFDIDSKGNYNRKGENDIAIHGETSATIGNKKYTGSATVEGDKTKYNIDIILDQPEGRSQFKSLGMKKGDLHWKSEYAFKWLSNGGGSMVGDSEINFEDENNFSMVANMDSPKMNLNKFHFEAKVTPDKKLNLNVQNNGKTVASAKASYQYTVEGSKRRVEGSGNINVDGKDIPLTYDATLDTLTENNPIMQLAVNAKAGDRTFKFTSEGKPNDFHMKRTYCKSAGDCSEAGISYENKHLGPMSQEQNFVYKLDFSMFNKDLKDLKIVSKIKREGLTYDQNFDLDWGTSQVKYVSYVHPNKAGASLALPQRTLAAEASYGLPKKDKNAVKFEGSVWLDKARAPNKRAHLLLLGEVGQNKEAYTGQAEARFNSPALPKPMIIKGKGFISNQYTTPAGEGSFEIDIFKKPQMKIAGNWKLTGKKTEKGFDAHHVVNIKSDGLKHNINWDRKIIITRDASSWTEKLSYTNAKGQVKEGIAKIESSQNKFHMVVKAADVTLMDYLVKWAIGEDNNSMFFTEELDLLGSKYNDRFDATLQPLKAYFKWIDHACGNKAFEVVATHEMGKEAKLDATFDGKTVLSGAISMAEGHFLRPSAKYDKDVVTSMKECYQQSGEHARDEVTKLLEKFAPNVDEEVYARRDIMLDAWPKFEEVSNYYQGELEKMQNEISTDENLQGIMSIIKESLSMAFENGAQTIEELQAVYNKIESEIQQNLELITKTVDEVKVKMAKSFEDLMKASVKLSEDLVHMAVDMSDLIFQEINAHGEDISALMKTIGDIMEDYGKMFMQYAYQVNHEMQEFIESTLAKLKELPIGELINEQVELITAFFENSESGFDQGMIGEMTHDLLEALEDVLNQLKESKSCPELEQLIDTIKTWIKKAIVDKEPVDNIEYTKKVAKELLAVFKHLMVLFDEQVNAGEEALSKSKLPTLSAMPLTHITPGLLRISGLSWLASSDLPSLVQVIATYWPAMSPDDWLPPFTARAYLLGGSEVITFDGAHISIQGDCNYVLTQDYIDGNFSVVGQFKGGNIEAIQVTDGKDTVELRHGKKPLVNGKESEFPIFQGQIRSWKRSSVVGLSTKSGLKILCTPDCQRCKIRLDGFYFGRVRGVLGTYNYEQFDDLVLPSGKIAENEQKFLTAWSVGGGCSVNAPAPLKREATCTSTFTNAPDFMACYHLVNPKPYREACDRLAAKETTPEGLQATVCNVALAYSLQCHTKIPTSVPPSCLKCTKTDANIFQTSATFEPPFKKADVVFTIERFDANKEMYENLIKPLVQTIKSELNAKGISDVKFGLVGFGGGQRMWPAYYTNNGKILSDDLETGNLVFDERSENQIDEAIEVAAAESGVTGKSMTYLDLAEFYPWRLGSSKVVLGVHATPCKKSHSFFMLQHLYYITAYVNKGISFHTVSPVMDLKLPGEDVKNVLAIGDDEVFMMKDAGKKPLKGHGNKEAEDKISYTHDVCFTFAHLTGGNIYPAENYINGGAAEKDAYKKIITTSVVESLTSAESQHTQKCSCHPKINPYDGIFSQPDCRTVNI